MTTQPTKSDSIGLQDLLFQLREELILDASQPPRLFFIDGVELELYVEFKRETKGGVKISILQFGGVEGETGIGRERGHRITLKLRPLITYEEVREQLRKDEQAFILTRLSALAKKGDQ